MAQEYSDKLKKGMAEVESLRTKATNSRTVYSSDPKKARLERRMDKIGARIKKDKESYK